LLEGGGLTLIISILSYLLTYFLSIFPISVGVANRIEKILRDFLWGGVGNESKFHLGSLAKFFCLLSYVGLGVRNLSLCFSIS
jgi:hypothetical protein